MPKIHIQFVSKSGSLYGGDPVIIETNYIPRIGEIITTNPSAHPYDLEGGSFMVQSVVSELTGDGLVPHITAAHHPACSWWR